jgi:D-tyrosyl-tRNA(Tyr) deacylase
MKAVVQRVVDATVTVGGAEKGTIDFGLLVYLGVAHEDTTRDADWIVEKTINLRIFNDSEGKMNLSLLELGKTEQNAAVNQGNNPVNEPSPGILLISQFTLLGDACKGRRPSWGKAAPLEKARGLYQYCIEKMSAQVPCASGEFQAHMKVTCTNDGPVTILLDSRDVL